MAEADYETTIFRAIPALLSGSVAGTAVTVLAMASLGVLSDGTPPGHIPRFMFNTAIILTPMVFLVFAAGAMFIAMPCWWVLHRMGRRSRPEALVLGGLLGGLCGFAPFRGMLSGERPGMAAWDPLEVAVALGIMTAAGAAAGLTVWHVAYRRGHYVEDLA